MRVYVCACVRVWEIQSDTASFCVTQAKTTAGLCGTTHILFRFNKGKHLRIWRTCLENDCHCWLPHILEHLITQGYGSFIMRDVVMQATMCCCTENNCATTCRPCRMCVFFHVRNILHCCFLFKWKLGLGTHNGCASYRWSSVFLCNTRHCYHVLWNNCSFSYAIFRKKRYFPNMHSWSTDSCMGLHPSYLRSIMSV